MKNGIILTVLLTLFAIQVGTIHSHQHQKKMIHTVFKDCSNSAVDEEQKNQCIENKLIILAHRDNPLAEIALFSFYKSQNNSDKTAEFKQKIKERQFRSTQRSFI